MPAYFDDAQRHATLRAAELAGLPKAQLLQGAAGQRSVARPVEGTRTILCLHFGKLLWGHCVCTSTSTLCSLGLQSRSRRRLRTAWGSGARRPTRSSSSISAAAPLTPASWAALRGMLEVLATAGDGRLGGDDFDAALAGHLVELHVAAGGSDAR